MLSVSSFPERILIFSLFAVDGRDAFRSHSISSGWRWQNWAVLNAFYSNWQDYNCLYYNVAFSKSLHISRGVLLILGFDRLQIQDGNLLKILMPLLLTYGNMRKKMLNACMYCMKRTHFTILFIRCHHSVFVWAFWNKYCYYLACKYFPCN